MKIAVVGTGYVGLSLAVLLAQHNEVVALDIDKTRVDLINTKVSPLEDVEISKFLKTKELNLTATLDKQYAYENAKFVIIATPTNFNVENNYFDTSSIENVVQDINEINASSTIIIKSTIPIGFISKLKRKFPMLKIMFSPEFLREGNALYDNLYPSRIIVGDKSPEAQEFANLLIDGAVKKDIKVLFTNDTEAESIKLFANTYLAMRVAFFNEIDNYCLINGLNAEDIIRGISLDERIGDYYNNPSFGYGGYCLPKDTKQLLANYSNVPQSLISAIIDSNVIRKQTIAEQILKLKPKVVGVYLLVMKYGSDNFRDAAVIDIIRLLVNHGVQILVYEPNFTLNDNQEIFRLESDLGVFKQNSDIILTNRRDDALRDVNNKLFTRDIFTRD